MTTERSWNLGLAMTIILLLALISAVPTQVQAQGEPEFRVRFSFGTIGINGEVIDGATGRRIDESKVTFTPVPRRPHSIRRVRRIRVTAPGFEPAYVRSFTRVRAQFIFFNFTVIDIGRVVLYPTRHQPPYRPRNQQPQANFTHTPHSPKVGEVVNFTARNSYDPDGYITSYSWDFDGDGRTDARGQSVDHRYGSSGNYFATLRVRDEQGLMNSTSKRIQVSHRHRSPVARFFYSPRDPRPGEEIRFDASNSYVPDGHILTYGWDFDGDGRNEEWGKSVTWRFNSQGNREVTLTVMSASGSSSSTMRNIRVSQGDSMVFS